MATALVEFTLSPRTLDDVSHSIAPLLLNCACDMTDPVIIVAHSRPHSEPDTVEKNPITKLCSLLFHILKALILLLDIAKLTKLSTPGALVKDKDKAYTTVAQYFIVEPTSVLQVASSWYEKTGLLCIVDFLSARIYPLSPTHRLMTSVLFSSPNICTEMEQGGGQDGTLSMLLAMRMVMMVIETVRPGETPSECRGVTVDRKRTECCEMEGQGKRKG
ncbi:hypothetical protein BDV98DRAFT_597658 [Pterulicium gracile]|uniref:Uncharacterized protein n=1 Tax=Pterulicium gracile TaxID=1884261 RepID=A0A5C3Q2S5_9AGAR|nr:hypothetical protein BDV98DRAFT_597658 [Pterula gracilis]